MKDFLMSLWWEREHVSFVTGFHLGEEPFTYFFSHVLPKSTYPRFKKNPDNVVFMTLEEHVRWEHHKSMIIDDPKWKHVFELEAKLKEQYHSKKYFQNIA